MTRMWARVRNWKSKLLFVELSNVDRWRPLASDPSGEGCFVGGLPREVGATGYLAAMLGNDDPWRCVVLYSAMSHGVVSPSGAFWHPDLLDIIFFHLN